MMPLIYFNITMKYARPDELDVELILRGLNTFDPEDPVTHYQFHEYV